MYLSVKDYYWSENNDEITISVPLKGVKAAKTDIITTSYYIKVNFRPYYFECLLFGAVNDISSKVVISDGLIVFYLKKTEPGLWKQLESDDMKDKEKMKVHRETALTEYQEKVLAKEKEQSETKKSNEKYALTEMMKLEDGERKRIEEVKTEEKNKAMEELQAWKDEQTKKSDLDKQKIAVARITAKEHEQKQQQKKEPLMQIPPYSAASASAAARRAAVKTGSMPSARGDIFTMEAPQAAPVRDTCRIGVNFTPRIFPTPERESTREREDEWLKTQSQRRQICESNNSDLTPEQKNPVWLRNKGNSLFKAGDYEAAVSAFTHAIEIGGKMHSLYSNRAACHLKMRNFFKALEDASEALTLLNPPVSQNAQARLRAHVRRGAAFCNLEMYSEGLMDYEAALKLDPNNTTIVKDVDNLRSFMTGAKDDEDPLEMVD